MRIKFLPITIFLIALSSQIQIVKAFDPAFRKHSQLFFASNTEVKLDYETITEIKNACDEAFQDALYPRLRQLSDQLMKSIFEKDSFENKLKTVEALLACKSPENAKKLLQRINPSSNFQHKKWSLLFWQASSAIMDHQGASFALRRLAQGDLKNLDREEITVGYNPNGSVITRNGLDLLAEHEYLSGHCNEAARILLLGRKSGALGASRVSRAIPCLEGLSIKQRDDLLASALVEANADMAWWLVSDILRLQLMLNVSCI